MSSILQNLAVCLLVYAIAIAPWLLFLASKRFLILSKFWQEHVDALEKQMNELMRQEKENYQKLHSMRDHAIKELQEVGILNIGLQCSLLIGCDVILAKSCW